MTSRTSSAKNLIAARKAKRTKAMNYKAGAAKRTPEGQALKKAGIGFDIETEGMTVTVETKPEYSKKTAKDKVEKRNRKVKVATGRRAKSVKGKKSLVKWKTLDKSRQRARGLIFGDKDVDVISVVISPRGRTILPGGVVSPLEEPPEDMPQSIQDYFLTSRAIRHMAYHSKRQILEIVFQTGSAYQFLGVPQSVWENLKMAQSKGRFFMDNIYGYWAGPKGDKTYFPKYTYRRVKDRL